MTELQNPIVRVLPLLGVPHLDRLFDYRVSEADDLDAQPGAKVRVRFSGRLVDAVVIERRKRSDHTGELKPIERVISPEIVMPPSMWQLAQLLADHYAGVRSDILRSAIPSRHASAEAAGLFGGGKPWEDLYGSLTPTEDLQKASLEAARATMGDYVHGPAFLSAVLDAKSPRASLVAPPGSDVAAIAAAVAAATAWNTAGSALIIVPNQKEVDRVCTALREFVSAAQIITLTAAEGPSARYRRYLSILHGQAKIVVGTRSAALAPLKNLQLIALLGESDDSLVDPRAPYMHARFMAKLRSEVEGTALLVAGVHRSAEVQQWIAEGHVHPLRPTVDAQHAAMPWIRGLGETEHQREVEIHNPGARIPSIGFQAIRQALDNGHPALVQVPRRGYAPALACAACRHPARCRHCNGPLELPSSQDAAPPRCRWCGRSAGQFRCSECGNRTLRMQVIGQDRTVEELGRAFPGTPIVASGGQRVLASVPHKPSVIVATPGAEPHVDGDLYGAALILDPWMPLGREDLRSGEHALRQWMEAAALVRPREEGGAVVIAGDASLPVIQQLIRWDPTGAATRELSLRAEAEFPPAATMAAIDGSQVAVDQLLECWERPEAAELLGPVELRAGIRLPAGMEKLGAQEARRQARRLIVRIPHEQAHLLGPSLKQAQSVRSTMKGAQPLRVVIDPVRIG